MAHLESIVVPSLSLENVPFRDAIEALHHACSFHDPRRLQGKPHGYSFIIKFDGVPEGEATPYVDPFDPFANIPPSTEYNAPNITIHANNQRFSDLLEAVCAQAGAKFTVFKKATIVIQPKESGQHHPGP